MCPNQHGAVQMGLKWALPKLASFAQTTRGCVCFQSAPHLRLHLNEMSHKQAFATQPIVVRQIKITNLDHTTFPPIPVPSAPAKPLVQNQYRHKSPVVGTSVVLSWGQRSQLKSCREQSRGSCQTSQIANCSSVIVPLIRTILNSVVSLVLKTGVVWFTHL